MSFKAVLAFEDGSLFYGEGFGKEKFDVGELVFNTSMTGIKKLLQIHPIKNKLLLLLILTLEIQESIRKIVNQKRFTHQVLL